MRPERHENVSPQDALPGVRWSLRDDRRRRPPDRRGAREQWMSRPGLSSQLRTEQCACGKCCFPSEEAAMDVVLEARIARIIRHNPRRKEDRHYRCRYGSWHTTSQPQMGAAGRAS